MAFALASPQWEAARCSPPAVLAGASVSLPDLLPGLSHLKKRGEFLAAAQGRKWAAQSLVLQLHNRGDQDEARVGFTATRKIGNAVMRNRVRRRLKAAASEILPSVAKPGYDYVLVGRMATLTRPWSDLLEDMRLAVGKVHSMRDAKIRSESKETPHG
jgi:ribonuclease P protein component